MKFVAYAAPLCSPALYGVLKSGGLLAGSAFTLDIKGVSILRLADPLSLLADPTLGVLSPSNLPRN
jgi:hypothetical protein